MQKWLVLLGRRITLGLNAGAVRLETIDCTLFLVNEIAE